MVRRGSRVQEGDIMTGTHHAKAGPVARLTRRLRPVPSARADVPAGNPQPPAAPESPWVRAELDRIEAEARAQQPLDSPVHTVADEYGMMPCCGQHETAVPQTDYVTADPRLRTCRAMAGTVTADLAGEHRRWYGWGDTAMDYPPAHDRPYVAEPEPYTPDLGADIRNLPVFRGTIRARARYFHRGCQCERWSTTGSAGWLASQYADMGPVVLSWRAAEPAQAVPVQSDDTLTWGRAEAA